MKKQVLSKLLKKALGNSNFNRDADNILINQGKILSLLTKAQSSRNIRDYEFKIFSQWGEDGIIQHLLNCVDIENKSFIEFGVEDFSESNCRFLLMNNDWQGYVIDGSKENINRLIDSYFFWQHDLQAASMFITRENINELLSQCGFNSDLGLLSIDLDGNDYYILEAIQDFHPRILICEFNPIFGVDRAISVPYSENFIRSKAHYSNLYYGASLRAISNLANKKGYTLIGTNSAGMNAFFVRNDLLNDRLCKINPEEAYHRANYRESRSENGRLSLLGSDDAFRLIEGLPVYNTESRLIEAL